MWHPGPFFRYRLSALAVGLKLDALVSLNSQNCRLSSPQITQRPCSSCRIPAKRKERPTGPFLVRFSPVGGLLADGRYNVTVACAGTRTAGELRAVTPPRRGERRCHRSVTFSMTSSTSRITGRQSKTRLRASRTRLPRTQASARYSTRRITRRSPGATPAAACALLRSGMTCAPSAWTCAPPTRSTSTTSL